jgi:hypothetical protein
MKGIVFMDTQDGGKILPKAPRHEGVDPLTDGNTYYSPENVKESSTYEERVEVEESESTEDEEASAQLDEEQPKRRGLFGLRR